MALDPAVARTVEKLAGRLEQLGIEYRIVGGVAVHTHGWARNTEDVDLLVSQGGYERIQAELVGRGYLPKFRGSKHLRDTETGVAVEFLIAGRDRPGADRAPVPFPDPASVPAVPAVFAPGAKVVGLETLIELKLLSYKYADARDLDLGDVVELIKRSGLPLELRDRLHLEVRAIYADAWERVQRYRADPGAADHLGEPTSPYFNEVATALERGELTVEEAIDRLTLD